MRVSQRVLSLILILAVLPLPLVATTQEKAAVGGAARETNQPPTSGAGEALARARQLAYEARDLEPMQQRISFLARLSDTLWGWDDALAEQLVWQSFDLILSTGKAPREEGSRAGYEPYVLYRQLFSMVAAHDPALSRRLAEKWKTANESEDESAPLKKMPPTQVSNFLLAEAARALKKDEAQARDFFRQSVSTLVLPAHIYFLLNLREQSPAVADRLFGDALGVLAQRPLSEPNEILALASYLFAADGGIGYRIVGGYNAANIASNVSDPPKNPALARQYLALLLDRLRPDEVTPPAVVYFALKNFLPQFRAMTPELADAAAAKMAALAPDVSPGDVVSQEAASRAYTASASETTRSWEQRLGKAEQITNPNLRDFEYFTIINGYLLPHKDFAAAERVAERIDNTSLRGKLADYVRLLSIQEGARQSAAANLDYGTALKKMSDPLLKVLALGELARAYAKRKETVELDQLLLQAGVEAGHISDDQDRIQAQLLVAQLYLAADRQRGFEAALRAIKEINKSSDFNIWRAGFSLRLTVYGMANELPLDAAAPASLITTIEQMCRADCGETFTASQQLADKSRSLWATLRAVSVSLAEAKKQRETRKTTAP